MGRAAKLATSLARVFGPTFPAISISPGQPWREGKNRQSIRHSAGNEYLRLASSEGSDDGGQPAEPGPANAADSDVSRRGGAERWTAPGDVSRHGGGDRVCRTGPP